MSELYDLLTYLVALNGGRVVGKTRLQKMVFLLDQCGLKSGCRYDYHYYGPFSAEISEAAEDACALGQLRYDEKPGFHAVPYGIYDLQGTCEVPSKIGVLDKDVVSEKLGVMSKYSAIELELAATLSYFGTHGISDAVQLTQELKPAKATPERLQRAKKLLDELGISKKDPT